MGWSNVKTCRHAYVLDRGSMPKERTDRIGKAVWSVDSGIIYVNCANCGSIIRLDGEVKVLESGFLPLCIVCSRCYCHIWIYLSGWDQAEKDLKRRYRFDVSTVDFYGPGKSTNDKSRKETEETPFVSTTPTAGPASSSGRVPAAGSVVPRRNRT